MRKTLTLPAAPISVQDSQDQDDLRIVEHLDMHSLPEPLQQMLSMATTHEEQDILLMATLTAASACMPNLYFRYGPTGKKYSHFYPFVYVTILRDMYARAKAG